VTVNGEKLAPGTRVQVFGREVPVDAAGKFAVRQILPAGNHVVSVITTGTDGRRASQPPSLHPGRRLVLRCARRSHHW